VLPCRKNTAQLFGVKCEAVKEKPVLLQRGSRAAVSDTHWHSVKHVWPIYERVFMVRRLLDATRFSYFVQRYKHGRSDRINGDMRWHVQALCGPFVSVLFPLF
jgi:hypothetical protein